MSSAGDAEERELSQSPPPANSRKRSSDASDDEDAGRSPVADKDELVEDEEDDEDEDIEVRMCDGTRSERLTSTGRTDFTKAPPNEPSQSIY